MALTLGVFGSPHPLWNKGLALDDLGITGVWVGHVSISGELVGRCHDEGARIYAEIGIMSGASRADYEDHPDVQPIGASGEALPIVANYAAFACPLSSWWRHRRLVQIEHLMGAYELDGVWLDFMRYPARWERPQPTLEQSCFCTRCLAQFEECANVGVPGHSTAERAAWILDQTLDQWTDWKCSVIAEFVSHASGLVRRVGREAALGMFSIPWQPQDFDNAIHRVIAQDFVRLAQHLDVFSPMLYHTMCGRNVEWVGEHIKYLSQVTGRPVVPIVQSVDQPVPMRPGEFRSALLQGLAEPSSGVMMYRLQDVVGEDDRFTAMREIYGGRG